MKKTEEVLVLFCKEKGIELCGKEGEQFPVGNLSNSQAVKFAEYYYRYEPILDLIDLSHRINRAIDRYHTLQLKQVSDQSDILRELTSCLAQLENFRADYYDEWLNVYFTCKHTSDAARVKWSDNEVKELHRIRKVMRGGYKVVESIRSTISVSKREH